MATDAPSSGLLATPRRGIDRAIYTIALIGILIVVHLWIMVGRGFDRGCFGFSEPTAIVECEAVIQSDAGNLFGVSNTIWGFLFYLGVVALTAAGTFGWLNRTALWRRLRAVLLTGGLFYSGWLVYVQSTQLGAYCKLCLISAALVTILFVIQAAEMVIYRNSTR